MGTVDRSKWIAGVTTTLFFALMACSSTQSVPSGSPTSSSSSPTPTSAASIAPGPGYKSVSITPSTQVVVVCGEDSAQTAARLAVLDAASGSVLGRQSFPGRTCAGGSSAADRGHRPNGYEHYYLSTDLTCFAGTQAQQDKEVLPGCYRPSGTFDPATPATTNTVGFGVTVHDALRVVVQPGTDKLWWIDNPTTTDQIGAVSHQILVSPTGEKTTLPGTTFGSVYSIAFDSHGSPVIQNSEGLGMPGAIACITPVGVSDDCGQLNEPTNRSPSGSSLVVSGAMTNTASGLGALVAVSQPDHACFIYKTQQQANGDLSVPTKFTSCPDASDAGQYDGVLYVGPWSN